MKCEECNEEIKKERGCNGGVEWEIGSFKYDGCPEKLVKEQLHLINMWNDWKIFGFPFPGHWSKQPKYIIDTIRTFENEIIVIGREK